MMTNPTPAAPPEDNFYREGLDPDQIKKLDRAATRTGLRDEVAYLRLMLQEAHWQRDTNAAVKIMNALARAEVTDARLAHLRPKADEEGQQRFLGHFVSLVKQLTSAENRRALDRGVPATELVPELADLDLDEAPAL
jgi:hypothetical protein